MVAQKKPFTYAQRVGPWRRRIFALLEEFTTLSGDECAVRLIVRFPEICQSPTSKAVLLGTIKNLSCQGYLESEQPVGTPSKERFYRLSPEGEKELARLRALDAEQSR